MEGDETTKGGIIIPDTAKEKPVEGLIEAVGDGKMMEDGKVVPLQVKVGDKVLFGKYTGQELTITKDDYHLISQSDILFIST